MTEMTNAPPLPAAVPQEADGASDQTIAWCLLSHTNIGKTTLARTLVAEDIGEVQDAAHVTSQSQRYLLQRTDEGDTLWLWDTPGFGDSVRLYNRLKQQGNPLGWFLSNVWDRWRDKPFYMSQRALQAARDHADVMLYLVNAAEDPADAGYWASEMRILQWMDKPVLVLLNQIGSDTSAAQTAADLQRWRTATAEFAGTVRSVQVLDAFTRSWWHEKQVMQSIAPLLPDAKQPAYQRLLQTRAARQQQREAASLKALAEQLLLAATAQETVQASDNKLWQRAWNKVSGSVAQAIRGSGTEGAELSPEQTAAMQRLTQSLQQADLASTQALLELHQLDGQAASQIQQQLKDHLKTSTPLDPQTASLWGALTAGAATGLGADMVAGGMTLGAGALVGALVGAVTFAGAAWSANKMFDQQAQRFHLSPEYLSALTGQLLLKYLVISHFGRGRGRYTSPSAPAQWNEAVQAAVQHRATQWQQQWKALGSLSPEAGLSNEARAAHLQALQLQLGECLHQALSRLYPDMDRPVDSADTNMQ